MSKLSNLLNMYLILQNRSIIKVKELAEIIEVSERTIKGYKEDLEKAGIYIGTKSGRYGGYYLENRLSLEGITISDEEIEALKMANEIIKSGNYVFSLNFEKLTSKIHSYKETVENINFFTKDTLKPLYLKKKEKKNWNLIKNAFINRRKIEIEYYSIGHENHKNIYSIRVVHPYGIFDYQDSAYLYGYCEKRKEIRHFKLSRIKSLVVLNDNFRANTKYDIKKEIKKSFGIMDDEEFYLKLKITYPMSQLVKENQYTVKQKITELSEDNIIYEANLKGYKEVKTWVLSMGSCVEVIEPHKLKEDIIKEANYIINTYIGT